MAVVQLAGVRSQRSLSSSGLPALSANSARHEREPPARDGFCLTRSQSQSQSQSRQRLAVPLKLRGPEASTTSGYREERDPPSHGE